jgi:hypothetical protein
VGGVSLQDALSWMNIYRELLAVDEHGLQRIRALMAAHSGEPDEYEADARPIVAEIERAMVRLRYWEEIVVRLQ